MAKRQSFADKASKKKHAIDCEVCGTSKVTTKVVFPQKTENGDIKYKTNIVHVCKCNQKEVYG
ncbi:MAG: hypothetical protein V3W18_01125 [candidate division Zixibacteria bacterium]